MAYMVDLIARCRCGRPASWQVFNDKNAAMGKFCYRCAKLKIAELNTQQLHTHTALASPRKQK
jgi:hypothetical protein